MTTRRPDGSAVSWRSVRSYDWPMPIISTNQSRAGRAWSCQCVRSETFFVCHVCFTVLAIRYRSLSAIYYNYYYYYYHLLLLLLLSPQIYNNYYIIITIDGVFMISHIRCMKTSHCNSVLLFTFN